MRHLVKHAEFELRRAGLFDKDSDYDGALAPEVMKLIEVFAAAGHSGGSAHMTLRLFMQLAQFKVLSPITSDASEWKKSDYADDTWQNLRQSSCFSTDGGATHYDIDANDGRAVRASASPEKKP